jgi:hypothetical protein
MINPRHFTPSPRTRWLSDLAAALDHAQRVLARLDNATARTDEAMHLAGRIAAIRSEVDRLRRGRFAPMDQAGRRSGHAEALD